MFADYWLGAAGNLGGSWQMARKKLRRMLVYLTITKRVHFCILAQKMSYTCSLAQVSHSTVWTHLKTSTFAQLKIMFLFYFFKWAEYDCSTRPRYLWKWSRGFTSLRPVWSTKWDAVSNKLKYILQCAWHFIWVAMCSSIVLQDPYRQPARKHIACKSCDF